MTLDRAFVEQNRAATERIRALAARLTEEQLRHPIGEHWTVSIALAHLAFWDRRVLFLLDATEQNGKLTAAEIDVITNDILLPQWAALPPREAARLALETAAALDKRLENFAPALLEEIYTYNKRWIIRALHRNEHLDEIEMARKS